MPSWRSRSTEVPATPRTSRILPPFGTFLTSQLAQQHAEALLVDVDVDRLLGVENVVEGDEHDAGVLGALDHRLEGRRVLRVDDDRVIAGIDEVVDRGDLRRHVLAGRDDLEFLELGRDVGLRRHRPWPS